MGQVAGGGEAQLGGQEGGSTVDAEDLVCGVEHMGSAGDGGEADAYSRGQGVLTVAATDHVGGVDDMAVQAVGDEAAGEGGGQGLASMAAHVPSLLHLDSPLVLSAVEKEEVKPQGMSSASEGQQQHNAVTSN